MYNLNLLEEFEKESLLNILKGRGFSVSITDGLFRVIKSDNFVVFEKRVDELNIFDVCDFLGISVVDDKYVYYLIDHAYDCECKKKSLRL